MNDASTGTGDKGLVVAATDHRDHGRAGGAPAGGDGGESGRPPGGDNATTSPTAAGQRGFRHELLLHRSTAELWEFVLPVVRDGLAAEEPTLLLVRPDTAETVLQQVGPSPYLTIAPALPEPGRPALHLRAARPMLAGYARVVHQEPVIPSTKWPVWRRLEALLNIVLRPHDTWAVCAYDRHALTEEMTADLHATHPLLAHHHQRHQRNDRYQPPVDFLDKHRDHPPDPVERTAPTVEPPTRLPAQAQGQRVRRRVDSPPGERGDQPGPPDRGGAEVGDGHRPPGADAVHAGALIGLHLEQFGPVRTSSEEATTRSRPWVSASMVTGRDRRASRVTCGLTSRSSDDDVVVVDKGVGQFDERGRQE